jgi:hypothetical protein
MGNKAGDVYTPEQLAAIKRMVVDYTPEQRAALQRTAYGPEQRAALLKILRIPTPSSKPRKPGKAKAKPKHTGRSRPMARVRPLVRKMFPPDGIAPDDVKTGDAVSAVQKKLPDIKRDVILRAIGRRKS